MVICLEQGIDLHMAQRISLPLTVSCFSKIQIGFTFLVPAHPGSPGQRAVKRVCVCALLVIGMFFLFFSRFRRQFAACMQQLHALMCLAFSRQLNYSSINRLYLYAAFQCTALHIACPYSPPGENSVRELSTLCLKKTRHETLAHNFPKC